jgi:hypothetical protein
MLWSLLKLMARTASSGVYTAARATAEGRSQMQMEAS